MHTLLLISIVIDAPLIVCARILSTCGGKGAESWLQVNIAILCLPMSSTEFASDSNLSFVGLLQPFLVGTLLACTCREPIQAPMLLFALQLG